MADEQDGEFAEDDLEAWDESWDEDQSEPIPELLHSLYLDGPFKQCVECDMPLDEIDSPYSIQKAYRNGEPVVEFALCDACQEALHESFSTETRQKLTEVFEEKATLGLGLEACALCQIDRNATREFNVSAQCFGDRMFFSLCICIECLLTLNEHVSKKTRDSRNDFMNRNFPGVPADSDVPVMI